MKRLKRKTIWPYNILLISLLYIAQVGCKGSYNNAASTTPTVFSITPADLSTDIGICSGNPCTGKILVTFSESMNPGLTQTLTTELWNGTTYSAATNAGTIFTWQTKLATNDTLTIDFKGSWYWFPENSRIRFTLAANGLQSMGGNFVEAPVKGVFTTATSSQSYAVADTGQTSCYNDTILQTCPVSGYPGQDADFSNTPTAGSVSGPTQYLTTTNYTTKDNVTNLVWKSCTEGLSGATCATGSSSTHTWYNALNQCASMNSGTGYAGRTNWRLPTMDELMTLPNFNTGSPMVSSANFPGTIAANYWSATTTLAGGHDYAWIVNFNNANSGADLKASALRYIRCVASGP